MAILISGGVYCPLSPEEPKTRIERLLAECKPACVLAHALTKDHFSNNPIVIDTPSMIQNLFTQSTADHDSNLTLPNVNDGSLAFVIFTSGSTGQPKGACLSHRNFSVYIKHEVEEEILVKSDTVLQRTPVTFNMHLQETVGALWIGSCIVLIQQSIQRDLTSILNAIAHHQITHILLTPTLLLALFKDTIDPSAIISLRVVQTGGNLN